MVVLAWETFQESYSVTLRGASGKRANQTKVLVVRNSKSICDAIRSTPGASPPALVAEPGRTSKMPASVRDRLSPTREGKLPWKVCLHPHLEQRGTSPEERSHGCG